MYHGPPVSPAATLALGSRVSPAGSGPVIVIFFAPPAAGIADTAT